MSPTPRRCRTTMRRARHAMSLFAILALGGLAACNHPIGSTSDRAGATPKAMAACRLRADEVFERQNRGEIYRADMYATGTRDAPFGSTGVSGNPGAGLPDRFARETMLDDCLNAAAGTPGASPDAPPPAGLAPDSAPQATRPVQ